MNGKHEGLYKKGNRVRTHGESRSDPEVLPFILLETKIAKLSQFIKDKQNVLQTIRNMVRFAL